MRVCIVYDCLYPYTIGGAERWYRNLAERLAAGGYEVTFLTRRQWGRGDDPAIPGVRVVAVSPRMGLYAHGRRRVFPPLLFGLGVLVHLLRHGRRYDVVHTASFPYFSLLAAHAARRRGRFRLLVDWHEVWTREYWREYLGRVGGRIGWRIQRACLRAPQRAFCFSRLHERRLRDLGLSGELTRLEGQYAGADAPTKPLTARPVAVFAGRHIPEKRVPALVPAIARAREHIPELRAEIYGDGPEREEVLAAIAAAGLEGCVAAPGFVDQEVLEQALGTALCVVLPSRREGYGLIVVESAARGVPSVVVAGPDNASTELVDEGANGFVAPSADADDLAAALVRVHDAGPDLRRSTLEWFRRNAERLSLERSLRAVLADYSSADS
jgi:glycosyltransferase involved in cell wall biosynthesis